jgi:hypothetical protein
VPESVPTVLECYNAQKNVSRSSKLCFVLCCLEGLLRLRIKFHLTSQFDSLMSSSEIKSIEAKFAALEARNNALEARVAFLESQAASTAPARFHDSGAATPGLDSAPATTVMRFVCNIGVVNIFSLRPPLSPRSILDATALASMWYGSPITHGMMPPLLSL